MTILVSVAIEEEEGGFGGNTGFFGFSSCKVLSRSSFGFEGSGGGAFVSSAKLTFGFGGSTGSALSEDGFGGSVGSCFKR